MEEKLGLREVFKVLNKYKVLIISITFALGLIAGMVSHYSITPLYESSTQILVNRNGALNSQESNQNIEADLRLIDTYSDIIKTPNILNQVIEKLNLNLTVEELTEKITVDSNDGSQVIYISVRDIDIERAVLIANTTVEVFSEEIKEILNVNNVAVISPAAIGESPSPVTPNIFVNTAVMSVIGLLVGSSLAFLFNYMNTTIRNEKDVENILNIPVLAMIPSLAEKEKINNSTLRNLERKEV
ncbi:YveK family protein [Planomicrobium sp. CPCC 101110]|uniref:YveK family protein n=1 Tax=Planomicrobium sp. CPCC 101110 TaxID=2599619 RepID=UPI0011B70246|nr:Wzz/FepE/Etk N-terminal domain-containing protein [Planomicrobium sp. CPCC 101110]TWT27786.1 capsular biosynthesis protein [Planomicrobium sp. CPCC 101110]